MRHLTNHERVKVLIIDDSSFDKNRSKAVELLARCFDHASQKMRFYKGFRILTLGWSDGTAFMPLDFFYCVRKTVSSMECQIKLISEVLTISDVHSLCNR